MRSRSRYLLLASSMGAVYGMLLGAVNGFSLPAGLGLGVLLGLLCGHAHTRDLYGLR